MRLYVGNLALDITGEELRLAFNNYKLKEFELNQGARSSFAILKVEDGERALKDMNGAIVKGCQVQVAPAVDREKQCKNHN